MIPRDIDKAIQFLLEQQAVTDARQQEIQHQIRELVDQNTKLSSTVDKLADGFRSLGDACRNLVEHARLTDARLTRLEQAET